ncbi:MAG: rod shape-determining protein [Candidatus Spechtbacteria bacterium SB0662_bin_43]|uniref:Cell shape-determining protein MreB n=1 Tax=Candidatus Spechtbacteria bacterium SB0662_bin_43 TaxID=2604897 RepID=A0A845DC32_9BACT|nr:rod shape-determining protein [Candidatus Spechtbacteria bacterium SB0662_bin_43]
MFGNVFEVFSKDLGIDLGTVNTLVYTQGRGIVINSPSVVALNKKTGRILAIGEEARQMLGKTPTHIVASKPLTQGVISEFEITEQMLRSFMNQLSADKINVMPRPRVVIGVPSGVTEVEKRAVEEAARNAGARKVHLIEEPIAAALGARLGVQDPVGHMIVDIGGGTTEIAVISLGGIVLRESLQAAGTKMNEDIINYAREELQLLLGERTAEMVKIVAGSALPLNEPIQTTMRGRDVVNGLPKEVVVTDEHIRRAIAPSVRTIVDAVRSTVEQTPPELIADIMENGIVLAGGGSLLRGLPELLEYETKIAVKITDDPLTAVVRGCGIAIEHLDEMQDILVDIDNESK